MMIQRKYKGKHEKSLEDISMEEMIAHTRAELLNMTAAPKLTLTFGGPEQYPSSKFNKALYYIDSRIRSGKSKSAGTEEIDNLILEALMISILKEMIQTPEGLLEEASFIAHDQWSGWMKYLFEKCTGNEDGTVTIPKELVDRWKRQMKTPYYFLPEEEKESDRVEARKYIELITSKD